MLKSLKTAASHEDIYVERYDQLLSWALQLTERDRAEAEDLLHDAFVHFTLVRPDLNSINHLDNYLLTILKNLHLSQIRRAMRSAHGPRSLVDFDSLRIGLRAEDCAPSFRFMMSCA
jgi:DNA-directed RNA polymerase specialized sigma24 family protein